jgi:hypothetical protein
MQLSRISFLETFIFLLLFLIFSLFYQLIVGDVGESGAGCLAVAPDLLWIIRELGTPFFLLT